jgi:hypothetical protein
VPAAVTPDNVSLGNSAVFEDFNKLTQPDITMIEANSSGGIGCGNKGDSGRGGCQVTVWSEMSVGPYDMTVISSDNSAALVDWLNDNGYAFPADGGEAVDFYVQKNWYFLGIKVTPEPDLIGQTGDYGLPPVEIRFPASKPVYPMVLTSLTSKEWTLVTLYLVSEHRMESENFTSRDFEIISRKGINFDWDYEDFLYCLGNNVFILEYAGMIDGSFVSRYTININKDNMTDDFFFVQADTDETFSFKKKIYVPLTTAGGDPNEFDGRGLLVCFMIGLIFFVYLKRLSRPVMRAAPVGRCSALADYTGKPAQADADYFEKVKS